MPAAILTTAQDGGTLRQMRKGTKSCQECRRRKIKCNYPPTPPSSCTSSAPPPRRCIECTTHNRECLIQGFVDPNPSNSNGNVYSNSHFVQNGNGTVISKPKPPRIYKRRRDVSTSLSSSPPLGAQIDDDADTRPRMKIHFDRMNSVVERLAKEQRLRSSTSAIASNANQHLNPSTNGSDRSAGTMNSALNVDVFETSQSFSDDHTASLPNTQQQQPIAECGIGPPTTIPTENYAKESSPLLSQLFNNEIFTQTTTTPAMLTQRVMTWTFSDTHNANTTSATGTSTSSCPSNTSALTDVQKLSSTIASEPYILDVLDISVRWWISWRDQSFALRDVFFKPVVSSNSPSTSFNINSDTKSSKSTSTSSATTASHHRDATPISLRDFVHAKLAHGHSESQGSTISTSIALLCIAISLQQLRTGVDDIHLNISSSPIELIERIVLAVDTIVLSPTSKAEYMREPGVLLLLMMRAKIYAEGNQLRKSWLSVRRAIEVAQEIGFTEPTEPATRQMRVSEQGHNSGQLPAMSEEQITQLFHRQRFVGSIMELDRLTSMVLGFPHVEDVKFTDRLAMAVLKGQTSQSLNHGSGPQISLDIRMRALRRIVAVVAGRVNDRNACSDSDDVKLQTTMAVQSTLNEAAGAMPQEWWDVDSHLHHSDPYIAHEHLIAQMWFWQVQAFLNLPFMLKPSPHTRAVNGDIYDTDPLPADPYEMNRFLCLQACRGMLKVFNVLRSNPSFAVYTCPCEDFQGVFSACILLVGLLIRISFCPSTVPHPPVLMMGTIAEDIALIEEIKDIFRYRALQQGGSISRQGLKVLEELGSFLDEDTSGGFFEGEVKRKTVILPYFGAIHLELKPPRHLLRTTTEESPSQSQTQTQTQPRITPLELAPPSSTEHSVQAGMGPASYLNFVRTMPPSEWDAYAPTGATFHIPVPEDQWDWDQFLFGQELAQNWDAEIPEWPVGEEAWEWS